MNERNDSCFKFTIGNVVYEFTDTLWKPLFSITVVDVVADDEVDLLVTDLHTHVNYDWNVHVNDILRAPRAEDYYDAITTGQLKMVPKSCCG